MTIPPKPDRAVPLLAIAGLLAVEFAVVAVRHWWVALLGDLPDVTALAITFAVTVAVLAGDRLQRAGEWMAAHARPAFSWGRLAIQLGAYVGFVFLTRSVVTRELHNSDHGTAWLAAWIVAGLAVLALGAWVALPLRSWGLLIRRGWKEAVLAGAVVAIAWFASRHSQYYWRSLADDTLRAVEAVLRLVYSDVTVDAGRRVIGAKSFVVHVAPSCSGYEGFGLVAAVIGCYLWLGRHALRFPAALLLLPIALLASWVLNVLRIAALIAVGAEGWPVIAVSGFHTKAGWLAFNAVALGVILLSRSTTFFARKSSEPPTERRSNPAASLLVPFLSVVAVAMVAGAASAGGVDRLYAVRVAVAGLVLWGYRASYGPLAWSWSWPAFAGGVAVFAVWIGLEWAFPPAEPSADDPFALPPVERWFWLVGRILGGVVVVPVVEELAFRGYLLRRLQGAELDETVAGKWDWTAVVASSILFGMLHPGRWVAGTIAGVAFAAVYYRRGRLGDAILAHAVANALIAAYVLATKQWGLW